MVWLNVITKYNGRVEQPIHIPSICMPFQSLSFSSSSFVLRLTEKTILYFSFSYHLLLFVVVGVVKTTTRYRLLFKHSKFNYG